MLEGTEAGQCGSVGCGVSKKVEEQEGVLKELCWHGSHLIGLQASASGLTG